MRIRIIRTRRSFSRAPPSGFVGLCGLFSNCYQQPYSLVFAHFLFIIYYRRYHYGYYQLLLLLDLIYYCHSSWLLFLLLLLLLLLFSLFSLLISTTILEFIISSPS